MGVCVVLKPSSPPNTQEQQIKHGEETACHLEAKRDKWRIYSSLVSM